MKRIVLCADDYGQAPAISEGILNLLANRRLSATSCMVNHSDWPSQSKCLIPFRQQIDIGLHLNLTEGPALSKEFVACYGKQLIPLKNLLIKALSRKLNSVAIMAECRAQISRFRNELGTEPMFIDGHQHVHQFPVIREVLIKVYNTYFNQQKPYIRWVGGGALFKRFSLKKLIVRCMGSLAFRRLLEQYEIPYNLSFAGFYSFSRGQRYDQLFPSFIKTIVDKGIIMCHPGLADGTANIMSQARRQEYNYLMGQGFLKACNEHKVVLSRFK